MNRWKLLLKRGLTATTGDIFSEHNKLIRKVAKMHWCCWRLYWKWQYVWMFVVIFYIEVSKLFERPSRKCTKFGADQLSVFGVDRGQICALFIGSCGRRWIMLTPRRYCVINDCHIQHIQQWQVPFRQHQSYSESNSPPTHSPHANSNTKRSGLYKHLVHRDRPIG